MVKNKSVSPIRDWTKIELMQKNFLDDEQYRNWLLFKFGVNMALRISDLLKIRVSDVYNKNMTAREKFIIIEQKTGKVNELNINDTAMAALEKYRRLTQITYSKKFMFQSRKGINK